MTVAALALGGKVKAQGDIGAIEQVGHLINDALIFSDSYVTPATDAAVYQSSSGWIVTPKKKEFLDVTIGLHTNIFFTPQRDREFTIHNSDFSFFQLEDGEQATVPTALGDDYQVWMTGMLGNDEVRLETPQGIDMETVAYPYLEGSVGLLWGTELVVKYTTKVKLKKSNYQVYGAGLKHNISQYFGKWEQNNMHLAVLAAYSMEEVSFNFLNVQTGYGSLGIDTIEGLVDTWQFQANGSKEYGDFELMGGFIVNTSNIEYHVSGEKGSIEEIVPFQQMVNTKLEEIYKTKVNCIGEASVRYAMGKFNAQFILAFGKFVNSNVSLQYSL